MINNPEFIIDSNILIESHRVDYGFDICPGFWELMSRAFKSGIVLSHQKVLNELRKSNDELSKWAKGMPKTCFPGETEQEFAVYHDLCAWAANQQYKQPAIVRFCDVDYADPWICAKAKVMGLTLVTQEVSAPYSRKDIKLPDACGSVDVPCINKYELLRRLSARFVLDDDRCLMGRVDSGLNRVAC